jgi:hypothetical protein
MIYVSYFVNGKPDNAMLDKEYPETMEELLSINEELYDIHDSDVIIMGIIPIYDHKKLVPKKPAVKAYGYF